MQIQPVTNQPKFSGKLVIDSTIEPSINELMKKYKLGSKFKQIAKMVQNKPYDVFIYSKKETPNFYYVAANKTEEQAKEIKEYTVKIQPEILLASIVDATKDAMSMYEKYIAKGIRG